jgi:hypothetical protein
VAQLIDEVTNEVDEEIQQEAVSEEVAVDDTPEHYRGKTPAELIKMHQEAESRIGQQGQEVGQLRKVVDDFILNQSKVNEPEQAEEIDFFAEPDRAVEHKISNHPTIKQLEQLGNQMRQSQTLSALQQRHPDIKEIAMDANFQKWVVGSKIRSELYERANHKYDYDAADELFSSWKSTQDIAKQTVNVERKERKQTLNAASTGGANGSSEAPSRKIYRRSDIIELMRTNPKRYQAMSDEIYKAYQEGRVKTN